MPEVELYATRMGDFRTEEGKKFLREISPLNHVNNIKRPLLIGQGANDPRVKQNESD
jgi:dipeptidyl aminopeptidase/acylaminoacyl peptidase